MADPLVVIRPDELAAMIESAVAKALARHQPAQSAPEPATMSIKAAMKELDAGDRTIRRWISTGKLRARRSETSGSGRVLIDVASIRELQGVRR